jgi:hypothetical protein
VGHSEWMLDGNETFEHLMSLITDFLYRSLPGS